MVFRFAGIAERLLLSLGFLGDVSVTNMTNGQALAYNTASSVWVNSNIAGGAGGGVAISAGTNSTSTGTVIFSNSNGVSFGMDTNGKVTGSVAAQSNQSLGIYASSNTTGASSSSTYDARSLSVQFLGAVSGGWSNGTFQISAAAGGQTNQTLGMYAVGNTTQNSSTTLDARTLSFDFLGAATGGYSNGSIQVSVPTQTAQTQSNIQAIYDGVNSISTGTIRFTNANGVSFSVNGQTLSASVAAQTNQSVGFYAVGNTTQNSSTTLDARTLSINGLGIITAGFSNGSIDISATQSAQTAGFYAVGNTTQSSSTTLDARTLSFNFLGAATGGFSNGSIDVSVPVQTNQTIGVYAEGNTAQTSSSTIDARSFSIYGSGNITVGLSAGSFIIAQTGGGGQSNQTIGFYATGNTTNNSSTTLDARSLTFEGDGGVTVGFSNGSIQISGNTGGAGGGPSLGLVYAVAAGNLVM